ncbi:CHAD domain-containing protein [Sphingomonas sp.]|uniref:CYTH and CHAD domain-containing protein n=1 Tax=Sphingomonas sp. TaxID=28214 RepID=UPI00325F9976
MSEKSKSNPQELELKLELTLESADRVEKLALLRGKPGIGMVQESIYFDAPGHPLREQGISLRVRRSGETFTQTIKRGSGATGLFQREEWEQQVEGFDPDPSGFDDAALRKFRHLFDRLEPVVRVEVDRSSWLLDWNGSQIELALDRGTVRAGKAQTPIVELELELKSGDAADLFDLARRIGETLPLRLSALSKADRGFRLASGEAGKAQKATMPSLKAGLPVSRAFTAIVMECVRHFRLNEPLIAHSPEVLHQARVAMRRLRAALSLFRGVIRDDAYPRFRDDLRSLSGTLGNARNLDVFIQRHGPCLSGADGAKLEQERNKAYAEVACVLASPLMTGLFLDLIAWAHTGEWRNSRKAKRTIKRFARKRLGKVWAKTRASGLRLLELTEEERHHFRIDVKKLRYDVQFLGSLFDDSKVREFTSALEQMQEMLGDLNDQVTAREITAILSLDFVPDEGSWQAARMLKKADSRYRKLERIDPFWEA